MNNKIYYTKKMIGKRVAVIEDYETSNFWFGTVESIKDEQTLIVKNENEEKIEVSIFNVRNPNQEIL